MKQVCIKSTFQAGCISLAVSLATLFPPATIARAQSLESIDLKGDCSYVHGVPVTPGATVLHEGGRTVELVAHGTEFGHHCGEDQGRFAFATLEGDFDVIVQVARVSNQGATHFYDGQRTPAKAGIMARESNDPNARYVAIWALSNDATEVVDGFQFDWRKVAGAWLGNQPEGTRPHLGDANCTFVYGYINRREPKLRLFERRFPDVWLRLRRNGQSFHAFVSRDGRAWHPTTIPSHETDFAGRLQVGVALAAAPEGQFDARAEAEFRNVSGLQPPAPPTPVNGPLKVSANARHFVDRDGNLFFWLGDTSWPLFAQYSRDQAEVYLRKRAAQGFTVIHSSLVWGSGSGSETSTPKPNPQGDLPWVNNDPATPNEAYFKYVDHLVHYAGEQGLVLALMPTWGFYIVDRPVIDRTKARTYGRWLAARYKDAPNIIWVSGGDRIPLGFEDVYRELAFGLHEGGSHLVSYHPSGWRSSSEYFHEEAWLDFNMIQTWGLWPQIYNAVVSDAWRTPIKPVVVSEPAYEDGPEYPLGPITPLVVRRQAWWTVMAGGSFTSGHTQMWRMDPGWEAALDSLGAAHLGMMRKILSRMEWWNMVPDQGLFLTGGSSERTLNTALRAKEGGTALIYLASQCHVLVNLEKFNVRRVDAFWIDPITGAPKEAGTYATGNYNGRSFPDRASAYFATPDFWEDALLWIRPAVEDTVIAK